MNYSNGYDLWRNHKIPFALEMNVDSGTEDFNPL